MLSILLSTAPTASACVPMMAFLFAVWWLDRYDREPVWLLGLTFLWGAIGSVLAAVIASAFTQELLAVAIAVAGGALGFDPEPWIEAAGPVVVAPLCEEPSKAVFLLYV